jgi:hypothetical protein
MLTLTGSNKRRLAPPQLLAPLALLVVVAVGVQSTQAPHSPATKPNAVQFVNGTPHLDPHVMAAVREATSTPAKVAQFKTDLARGAAAMGLRVATASDVSHVRTPSVADVGSSRITFVNAAMPKDLTAGWNGHFWLIATYADIINAGVAGATAACVGYLGPWICAALGGLAYAFVRGAAAVNNHGIWITAYVFGGMYAGRW